MPEETVTLSVEQLVTGSHQRGGRRVPVGRVVPGDLDALLAAQVPGRYRVTCLDARGRFIRRGAFAVEVGPEAPSPRVVRARTSRDYPTRSPLAVVRKRHREAAKRVVTLRQKMVAMEGENARLLRDAAVTEAGHLAERLRDGEDRRRLQDEVVGLSRQVAELRAYVECRDRALREYVDGVLRESFDAVLTERLSHYEPGTVESAEPLAAPLERSVQSTPGEQVVAAATAAVTPGAAVAPVTRADVRGAVGRDGGRVRGLAAMAAVVNVHQDRPEEKGTEQRPGAWEQLGRFFREVPPKR